MKYCNNCGNQIDDNAIFCSRCGARTNGEGPFVNFNPYGAYGGYNYQPYYDTNGSVLLAILSFVFWQVGLIIWLTCRRTRPGKARSAAKGALSSAAVSMPPLGLALWILWKGDPSKKDYAKVVGISAIVGAGIIASALVLAVIANLMGVDYSTVIPNAGGMAALIGLFR